ncbi:hypothetical protein V8C86DRAFT_2530726 [Haematococcus lacustris]
MVLPAPLLVCGLRCLQRCSAKGLGARPRAGMSLRAATRVVYRGGGGAAGTAAALTNTSMNACCPAICIGGL